MTVLHMVYTTSSLDVIFYFHLAQAVDLGLPQSTRSCQHLGRKMPANFGAQEHDASFITGFDIKVSGCMKIKCKF